MDFRPEKLRLGTGSENATDAYNNGKRDGAKNARVKCVSYIDGVYELMHDSQCDAVKYLRHIGYDKASHGNICMALNDKYNAAYDRTWEKYDHIK